VFNSISTKKTAKRNEFAIYKYRLFLLLVSPINNCSTVLTEVEVALHFSLFFFVDFVLATSFWTLHFSLPSLISWVFLFTKKSFWSVWKMILHGSHQLVNFMRLIQISYERGIRIHNIENKTI